MFLQSTHLLYTEQSGDTFLDYELSTSGFVITAWQCITTCDTQVTDRKMAFSLLKYTSTATLGAAYTVDPKLSCFDTEMDTTNNITEAEVKTIEYLYGPLQESKRKDGEGTFGVIPPNSGTPEVSFTECASSSCQIKLRLLAGTWDSGITVSTVTLNDGSENKDLTISNDANGEVVFGASQYAGKTITITWVYMRNGRRLRTVRELSASPQGHVRILPLTMMQGDTATVDEGVALAHEEGHGNTTAPSPAKEDDDVSTVAVVLIILGSLALLAGIFYLVRKKGSGFFGMGTGPKYESIERRAV